MGKNRQVYVGVDFASGPDCTVTYLVESVPTGCVTAPRIVMLGTADAPSDLLRYTAMIERRGDAIREALAAVPAPEIEEARPMNRKQRRNAARRGR